MFTKSRYLLIMACSQQKRSESHLLPALERYDGPPFRVLRRFLREHHSAPLDIHILSAKFGLIPGSQLIPNYDHRITPLRAQELRPYLITELKNIFDTPVLPRAFPLYGTRLPSSNGRLSSIGSA